MKTMILVRLLLAAALLALAVPLLPQSPKGIAHYGSFGVDLTSIEKTVKPGDDFWTYVNGGWDARTAIASDRPSAGSVIKLRDEAEVDVRMILDEMARNPAEFGVKGKQIGDFYTSWMDEAGISSRGAAPLKPYLDRIGGMTDKAGIQRLFATPGYASPVTLGIIPDFGDPTRYTATAGQGGLGMARDNYLLEGVKYEGFRQAYRAYLQHMLELAGIPGASSKADAVFALETALAKVQWSPAESRDVAKLNDPETIEGLMAKAPDWDWGLMLKTAGLESSPRVLMQTNTALTAMGKIFTETPLQTWKDYLAFHFVSDNAPYLPKAFDNARFSFYSKTLSGIQEQRDRWRRGVQLVNSALGEAVGQVYVARHFPPAAEKQMGELIENLRGAYRERIGKSAWMDDATRQAALKKLAAFEPRIGHPASYIDYSALAVDRNDILGNIVRSEEFQYQLQLKRFPNPVDRTLWGGVTPQTVNAFYNSLMNQITFPAAILQPPFFDPNADQAVNYGAIGAIIGHEMGHGFDDQGSQFGPTGKFENWWTDASRKAFKDRTAALRAQYDTYEPIPGTHINGALTMGENIGDLGGIEAAYAAYERYQTTHGKAQVINGLTGNQRFFLAYAQAHQSKQREDAERQALLSDAHSPDKYRVNGIVRNVDAWYGAFNVKPGDKLYLPSQQRVHIW
jgi:endothelin-converting enzyme/putative endopeptidase